MEEELKIEQGFMRLAMTRATRNARNKALVNEAEAFAHFVSTAEKCGCRDIVFTRRDNDSVMVFRRELTDTDIKHLRTLNPKHDYIDQCNDFGWLVPQSKMRRAAEAAAYLGLTPTLVTV